METFDRLRQFAILSHFSDQQIERLSSCTSRVRCHPGSLVLKEGENTTDFYLIDTGEIQILRNTPYGSYTLARLKAGDVFGETSFIDENARSGDAEITQDAVLFAINPTFSDPSTPDENRFAVAVYWTLWKSLSSKLRKTNEALAAFFSQAASSSQENSSTAAQKDAIHVGITAKRSLFREQTLSHLEINFLATLSKEERIPPNEHLFREGEPGNQMYVVLEGQIMISKNIVGAGEEALAFLERGAYFGEMALIDNEPRSADARAHENGAIVLSISREVLEGLLDIHRFSSLKLLRILCKLVAKRLRKIDDKLVGWFIFSAGSGDPITIP